MKKEEPDKILYTPTILNIFCDALAVSVPAEVRKVMHSLNDYFQVETVPFSCDSPSFISYYQSLEQAASNYLHLPKEEKHDFLEDNLNILKVVEFQASWHVLHTFLRDDALIKSMTAEQRQENFLFFLYRFSDYFPFLPQREAALQNLQAAGMIPDLRVYHALDVSPADKRIFS